MQWSGELGYGVRPPEGGQSAGRDDAATGNISIRTVERDKIPRRFGGKVPRHVTDLLAAATIPDAITFADRGGHLRRSARSGSCSRATRSTPPSCW